MTIWLGYVLTSGDHRMTVVEGWARQHLESLRVLTGTDVHPLDLADDRLAGGLLLLSADGSWQALEAHLTQETIRVYELLGDRVNVDGTSLSGYWAVTEGGEAVGGQEIGRWGTAGTAELRLR